LAGVGIFSIGTPIAAAAEMAFVCYDGRKLLIRQESEQSVGNSNANNFSVVHGIFSEFADTSEPGCHGYWILVWSRVLFM